MPRMRKRSNGRMTANSTVACPDSPTNRQSPQGFLPVPSRLWCVRMTDAAVGPDTPLRERRVEVGRDLVEERVDLIPNEGQRTCQRNDEHRKENGVLDERLALLTLEPRSVEEDRVGEKCLHSLSK